MIHYQNFNRQKKLYQSATFVFLLIILFLVVPNQTLGFQPQKKEYGGVRVLLLSGTAQEMGFQYGRLMKSELENSLQILKKFYTTKHQLTDSQLYEHAKRLYARFPLSEQYFIQGEAQGAKLRLEDAQLLNAMETLGRLLRHANGCAFIYFPKNKTITNTPVIARNYDFHEPYDQLANYLTITILRGVDSIPTAFIALPGEIY